MVIKMMKFIREKIKTQYHSMEGKPIYNGDLVVLGSQIQDGKEKLCVSSVQIIENYLGRTVVEPLDYFKIKWIVVGNVYDGMSKKEAIDLVNDKYKVFKELLRRACQ